MENDKKDELDIPPERLAKTEELKVIREHNQEISPLEIEQIQSLSRLQIDDIVRKLNTIGNKNKDSDGSNPDVLNMLDFDQSNLIRELKILNNVLVNNGEFHYSVAVIDFILFLKEVDEALQKNTL